MGSELSKGSAWSPCERAESAAFVTMGITIVTIPLTLHLLSYFVVKPKGKPSIQRTIKRFRCLCSQAACFNASTRRGEGQYWQII